MPRISVIVPTRNPGAAVVRTLEERLWNQTCPPLEIVVVDSGSSDGSLAAWSSRTTTHVISPSDFDHGGTRNLAAEMSRGDVFVYLTQDALPEDETWLERLVAPLSDSRVGASYARQVPRTGAGPSESFARSFSYGAASEIRCGGASGGVRTVYFSNAGSAIRADVFEAVGGFPEGVIMNEDMVFATRVLAAGHCIAYAADARLVHSHDYSLAEIGQRYFDIGVAMSREPELGRIGGTSREGLRFTVEHLRFLSRRGAWSSLPRAIAETLVKYVAFRLGRSERLLPVWLKRRMSMHTNFWR